MVTFKINGQTVQGEEGQYIKQVADKYGVDIPTLCHHKALEPAGMCRICTVELFDGRRSRFVTACNYPIWDGMEVQTDSESVHEGRKLIVELLLARCPEVPLLQELAAKYGIDKPRFKAEDDTCILCGLCVRMCEKMGNSAIALTGRGVEMKVDTPFHLQTDVCLACGACASVCPTGHITLEKIREEITRKGNVQLIPSEYDMGLKGRKPVYVPYAQAVPNTPAIDRDVCVHFKTGGCKVCVEFCGVDAIDHTMEDEVVELEVGSIILAPGFQPFDPSKFDAYNYANHPNVITSMEMERLLSASGPTGGHLVRLSDHKEPKKVAWFQCVGSRDLNRCDNSYCSSVCCMYAIKEAVIAKEHAGDDLDCAIFYMDMRTHGKDFERFYNNAQDKGVRFLRSRVHTIDPVKDSDEVSVRYVDDAGNLQQEQFDMIVLSIGLETSPEVVEMAKRLDIELTPGNFCKTDTFEPVATSKPGIYVCGAFQGPKDIPQSVVDASAAASAAGEILAGARNTATRKPEVVPQTNVIGERPRVGVFVCRCGINIAGVVDVPSVAEYAATLPYVEFAADNLYSCSQDTQDNMSQIIKQKKLNRVVVAACTPKTHEPLFQETLLKAGLNKYLFEMANIRNHDSWVHKNNPELATKKAKDLVRMAVTKVALAQPLEETELQVNPTALVIGGGIAGMTAARSLAQQGYETHIVERGEQLGGQAHNLYKTISGDLVADKLGALIGDVSSHPKIQVHLNTQLSAVDGFVGNFKSTLSNNGNQQEIEHGVAVVATGGAALQTDEYGCGQDPRIMTSLELDKMMMADDPALARAKSAVFIQCVGSREPQRPYCSRVCCTHSIDNALELKKRNPEMNVYILYRDIRTYGEREYIYKEAREKGVIFIRYNLAQKPEVALVDGKVQITVTDHVLGIPLQIDADLLTLATAVIPNKDDALANFFKVPLNDDGFFVEKHAKLGPSEFATDGVFLCGLAHYPKPIDEAIVQGRAAASRAVTLLARETVHTSGQVAQVDPMMCSSCGVCVSICPYSAPSFIDADARMHAGKAQVNPVLCKGCGLCVASCRSGAIHLKGFDNNQIFAQISAVNWD
ncbi:FAD-dependent oxidoreductase [Desulfatitalea alkaliphila]|uniref:FAD-dependent oxidoreductase n=1 Tax=Desulfatitalea alkaliphila TaxID=2929485 RepID=A0AA41R476_9BACT|nr:FAD-dependent oxidoreductase [Desulfatitalea alkaliphila]MCJ8503012.1 FAD-dependent oxidoreductase [Desulfatitalea alkaliphila]